jgi:hypothetical protein
MRVDFLYLLIFNAKELIHKKTLLKIIKSRTGLKIFSRKFEKKIKVKKINKKIFCLNKIGLVSLNFDFGIRIAKTLGKPKFSKKIKNWRIETVKVNFPKS